MKTLTQILVPLLLGALTACGGGHDVGVGGSTTLPESELVTVEPKSITLKAGDMTTFTGAVQDATEANLLWSVQGGKTHGTITSEGVYTAPAEAGSYTVVATNAVDSTQMNSATVTVMPAGPVSISPNNAWVDKDGNLSFTASVTDAPGTAVTWRVDGPDNGTITSDGLYTAPTQEGTYKVIATSVADPTKTATTLVSVGTVTVTVSPTTASLDQGASTAFTATVTGTSNTAVTWRVDGTGNGTITSDGVYTAPSKAGTFKVIATSVADPTKKATATVTVGTTAATVTITVSPATVSLDQGASTAFTATVTGTSNTAVTWRVDGTDNGTITSDGVYTAPSKAGTYKVIATSVADPTKTATATVTVGTITVTVSPTTASLDQGASTAFTATVTGTSNTAVTWRVDGTGNGTITSDGVYTAPSKAGTFKVIVTSVADPTKTATATVTVGTTAATVTITISPATVSLDQGASTAFTATVTGTSNTAVTWRVDGTGNGTITSDGVYTAPSKAGTFKVIVTSVADPTKKATATITVAATTGSP